MAEVEDLTGKSFGRWTVLSRAPDRHNKNGYVRRYWVCQCSCEDKTIREVYEYRLIHGDAYSCGCYQKEVARSKANDIDLIGRTFDRWAVIARGEDHIDKNGHRTRRWVCICSCEEHTIKTVLEPSLLNGHSTSCGCKRIEAVAKSHTRHGLSGTRIKKIYYNMHSRCENQNTPKFYNHGGRGIKVCDEWFGGDGLVRFYNWAMKNGYAENLTLDRIDNDGDYSPSNCRWVDYRTQNLNKRDNRLVTIGEETKPAVEWCDEYGVNPNTFAQRLNSGVTGSDLLLPPKVFGGCSSGFVGVHRRENNGKWRARISKDGVSYDLGTHDKLEDAVRARLDGELEHYGRYLSNLEEANRKLALIKDN